VQESAAWELDRELRSEGPEDFEASVPLVTGWVEVFVAMRVVADGADVVGYESVGRGRHLVVGDDGIVRFAEAVFVDEGEVADV
jgi:hypothetical protein